MPRLPSFILTDMTAQRATGGVYDIKRGGQWVDGEIQVIPFKGALMPLSNQDLQTGAAQGWYTSDDRKIYTNGFELKIGDIVTAHSNSFLVKNEMTHVGISNIKIYLVTRKGAVEK